MPSASNSTIKHLKTLLPLFDEINALQNNKKVLNRLIKQLAKETDCQSAAIVVINQETELLEIRNYFNMSWDFCKNYHRSIESQIMRDIIWNGTPVDIAKSELASEFAGKIKLEHDFISCYASQLIANQQPLGFLYLDSNHPYNFSEDRQLLIQLYGNLISMAIYLERVAAEINRMDSQEKAPGLMGFESYFPLFKAEFNRAQRHRDPFSVIILDVVQYSEKIKKYGLEIAQSILKELVDQLQKNMRNYDSFSRFGADEFFIALPAVTLDDAAGVARKIEDLIREFRFTENELEIQVSMGVANFPENCKEVNGLVTAAKKALIKAKTGEGSIFIAKPNSSNQ